jgi:hypothetical protein
MPSSKDGQTIYPSIQQGVRKEWRGLQDGTKDWWRDFRRFSNEPPVPGRAILEPTTVKAGERTILKLAFQVGKGGLEPYGHIAVECPLAGLEVYVSGKRYRARVPVISAHCSTSPADLDISFSSGIIDIMNRVYSLKEGEMVEILLGDPRESPSVMPTIAQEYPFAIALDRSNTGLYNRIAEFPILQVTGGAKDKYHVVARPLERAGKPIALLALPIDRYGNPSGQDPGIIAVTSSDPTAKLSVQQVAERHQRGKRELGCGIEGILNQAGVQYITVCDQALGVAGASNPILVHEGTGEDYNLFFGDIHGHNVHCDGSGSADEYYRWARDVRLLDFSALTNHVEEAKRYRVQDFWPIVKEKAAQYNEPGRFVSFLAFEWGSWERFGDKCVYYEIEEGDCFGANAESSNTPDKLWRLLRGKPAITIAHHCKYGGKTDWSYHDPELQPLVEIYSTWGSSEEGGEHCVQKAWDKGYKLGVLAGSDTHTGTPGNEGAGLAAVWAKELTRKDLFEALRKRRCYGTTGTRILLDFHLNDRMMGNEIREERGEERVVTVLAAGTANIDTIEILKNNAVVHTQRGSGKVARLEWSDPENERAAGREDFYYVRVTQTDGNRAWSSPIWISSAAH